MNMLNKLVYLTNQRVRKYGAQYYTFSAFGLINYPLAYLYEVAIGKVTEGFILRLLATLLCLIILLKDKLPKKLKKFIPLLWYLTIIIALPTIASFMLLKENFSLAWLVNFNIGVMILVLLVDSISFLIIETIGISIGVSLFYFNKGYNQPKYFFQDEYLYLFLYMFFCVTILGSIFTRNKEIYNDFIQKNKDNLNHQLEEKVKNRTLDLMRALDSKAEFLNNMSHEIRTPIQGFTTISEGLVEYWNNFTDQKKFALAKQVASSAKRIASLLNNLLDLSKLKENKMIMNFQEFDLNQETENLIQECTDIYLNDKSMEIIFNECTNPLLIADKDRIRQVIHNLISNSIKFSFDDSQIIITINNSNNNIIFTISDHGPGIPLGELQAIFDPFTQSSLTKTKAGGTGLGLSICKQIITSHSGKIWAKNNYKEGAIFHFTIPSSPVSKKDYL